MIKDLFNKNLWILPVLLLAVILAIKVYTVEEDRHSAPYVPTFNKDSVHQISFDDGTRCVVVGRSKYSQNGVGISCDFPPLSDIEG